ncbi:Hypothetical protein CINCED_3A010034 [Cinara cedri]|uniref:Uncharacterized protein n=1 Tax=Cinara cedri TaxID=506608 RepID=A0A5E4N7J7_9HEMI|nr:Hypothetical protein CINCED_3A010034 [Cinara cedri]
MANNQKLSSDTRKAPDVRFQFVQEHYEIINKMLATALLCYKKRDESEMIHEDGTTTLTQNWQVIISALKRLHYHTMATIRQFVYTEPATNQLQITPSINRYPADTTTNFPPTITLKKKITVPDDILSYYRSALNTKKYLPSKIPIRKPSRGFIPTCDQPAINTTTVLQPFADTKKNNLATSIPDLQTLRIITNYKNTSKIPIRVPFNDKIRALNKLSHNNSANSIRPSTSKKYLPSKISISKPSRGFIPTYDKPALNTFAVLQRLPDTTENNLVTSILGLQTLRIITNYKNTKNNLATSIPDLQTLRIITNYKNTSKIPICVPFNDKIRTLNKLPHNNSANSIRPSTSKKYLPSKIPVRIPNRTLLETSNTVIVIDFHPNVHDTRKNSTDETNAQLRCERNHCASLTLAGKVRIGGERFQTTRKYSERSQTTGMTYICTLIYSHRLTYCVCLVCRTYRLHCTAKYIKYVQRQPKFNVKIT